MQSGPYFFSSYLSTYLHVAYEWRALREEWKASGFCSEKEEGGRRSSVSGRLKALFSGHPTGQKDAATRILA